MIGRDGGTSHHLDRENNVDGRRSEHFRTGISCQGPKTKKLRRESATFKLAVWSKIGSEAQLIILCVYTARSVRRVQMKNYRTYFYESKKQTVKLEGQEGTDYISPKENLKASSDILKSPPFLFRHIDVCPGVLKTLSNYRIGFRRSFVRLIMHTFDATYG